jgi:hypothetical protein
LTVPSSLVSVADPFADGLEVGVGLEDGDGIAAGSGLEDGVGLEVGDGV